jgi:intron-binding protein aquarius
MVDTFLSAEHLASTLLGAKVPHLVFVEGTKGIAVSRADAAPSVSPPFKLKFLRRKDAEWCVLALSKRRGNYGPYPEDEPRKNTVRFTPTQFEAIRSGMSQGLTMIVGPPGTGKTDVAVQIISNIYHNFPEQVRAGELVLRG